MINFPTTLDLFDVQKNDETLNRLKSLAAKYEIQRFAVRIQSLLQQSNNITKGCNIHEITIHYFKSNNTTNISTIITCLPSIKTEDLNWIKKQTREYIQESITEHVKTFIKSKMSFELLINNSNDVFKYIIKKEDINNWIKETVGEKNYSIMEAEHLNSLVTTNQILTDVKKV